MIYAARHRPRPTTHFSLKKAPGLGTLRPTLDWPFTFFPWSPNSCPFRQEPMTTFQSSNGCALFRAPKSTRRLAPSGEVAVFPGFVTCLPSQPTCRRLLTLTKHRSHQTGGCPWSPTSDLYHLPIASTAHRVLTASADAQSHLLHSTFRWTSSHAALGGRHTIQSGLGLAIRLVVGGLTHSTSPYHLS
jgi:hypothetical protein